MFSGALKEFAANPGRLPRAAQLMDDLTYGWGNETFSALNEYIAEVVTQTLAVRGPILECGSGLTTILMGTIAQETGRKVWTLENSPQWADQVQAVLDRRGITSVRLCVAPLRDYGGFEWYDPPLNEMPDGFRLVVCDGPPGDTKGGRYGLLPVMTHKLAPRCIVLLDDAAREGERQAAARWQAEDGASIEAVGADKPFFRIVIE